MSSLKHLVRAGFDRTAAAIGVLRSFEKQMRPVVTVLMYHRVLAREDCARYPHDSLVIPAEAFDAQVRWLTEQCRVRTVRDALMEARATARPADRPLVAITFDDGYADNYDTVARILERHGVRGTFFVTTGFIETRQPLWYDRAAHAWQHGNERARRSFAAQAGVSSKELTMEDWLEGLKRLDPAGRSAAVDSAIASVADPIEERVFAPMRPSELRELQHRGHEVASHTVTHPILPQLNDASIKSELVGSKSRLEEWIDDKVIGFCYPNGDYDDRTERAVKQAGYAYACTTKAGLNDHTTPPTRLGRVDITMRRVCDANGRHDPLGFRAEVCQWREWCRRVTRR